MSKNLLPSDFMSWSFQEREQFLRSNADQVIRDDRVQKPLTEDELDEARRTLQKLSIKLKGKKDDYDDLKKEKREEINELEENINIVIEELRYGKEEMTGDTFILYDYDAGRATKFAPDGTIVEERPLRPDERQSTIHTMSRAANNNDN